MSSIIKITSELEDEDYLINKLIKISEYALINDATLEYYCKSGVWSIVAAVYKTLYGGKLFCIKGDKVPALVENCVDIWLNDDSEFKKCIDII